MTPCQNYHFPIGHFSVANFSFIEVQPHFKHLPIPSLDFGFQYGQEVQVDLRLASSSSSAIVKPAFAQRNVAPVKR